MVNFNFDPTDGIHLASKLSDQELDFLQRIVAVELAIRLEKTAYESRFHSIADHRTEMEEIVCDWRRQRDRMMFITSVRSDLDELLVLEEH